MNFLIVEDTTDVADAIADRLSGQGHSVERAENVADAMHLASVSIHDLVVLDINLPDGSGLEFLKWLRARHSAVAVLVLTARLDIDDKIDALDLGADDYMVKPFDLGELEARLRAIIRRRSGDVDKVLTAGDLTFDMSQRTVKIGDVEIELTKREQTLLEIFMLNRNRVLEKEDLLVRLFGLNGDANSNAVELYVGRLRRKIANSGFEIRTLRGLGYQAKLIKPAG